MIFLKLLGKLLKILQSGGSPRQIAWGFALGTIPGWTPLLSLHNLAVLVLLFILNVNFSAALLSFALISLVAWIPDPFFHLLGFAALVQVPFLHPLWTWMYNVPVAPLTRFNNTVVLGSFLFSLLLLCPSYFFFKWVVVRYRASWHEKVIRWKIMKIINSTGLVQWYSKLKTLGG